MKFNGCYELEESDVNLGPFYKTDIRKIAKIYEYYKAKTDDIVDVREHLKERVSAKETLFFTGRRGKEVFAYASIDPIIGHLGFTHFWKLPYKRVRKRDCLIAMSLVVDHGFRVLGLEKITQVVIEHLLVGHRMIRALGFKEEGNVRCVYSIEGCLHNATIYGMLKEEWESWAEQLQ